MTEADLYPHLAHLPAGRCTRMWSPAGWQAVGGASVGGFQPDFIGVSGRDGRAGGVLSVGADRRLCRDCDAGASDTSGRP